MLKKIEDKRSPVPVARQDEGTGAPTNTLEGEMPAMENTTREDKTFLTWVKIVNAQHHDILKHMRNSMDPLDRVIARRIMETAGEIKS
jgi:hypothetical protein